MRITLLGTGVPKPQLERASSGYMVEVGGDVILFDQGPGTYHRMMEAGKRAVDVTHVFFSHLHYDHCLDYARLLLTHWDQGAGKVPELNVFGPPHTKRMTRALIGPNGAFGPDLRARTEHQASEIRSGQTIAGNGWTVTVASVPHAQPYLVSYGFRLDSPDGSFAYSGDCGPCTAMRKLARDVDVLVYMCAYYSGTEHSKEYAAGVAGHREVARIARDAGAKSLVVSHVLPQIDRPGMRERVIREIGEIYPGNVYFGEDLMVVPVGDPTPTDREK
jgi:ribonuclease Z